jgi:hypothetical protein
MEDPISWHVLFTDIKKFIQLSCYYFYLSELIWSPIKYIGKRKCVLEEEKCALEKENNNSFKITFEWYKVKHFRTKQIHRACAFSFFLMTFFLPLQRTATKQIHFFILSHYPLFMYPLYAFHSWRPHVSNPNSIQNHISDLKLAQSKSIARPNRMLLAMAQNLTWSLFRWLRT